MCMDYRDFKMRVEKIEFPWKKVRTLSQSGVEKSRFYNFTSLPFVAWPTDQRTKIHRIDARIWVEYCALHIQN